MIGCVLRHESEFTVLTPEGVYVERSEGDVNTMRMPCGYDHLAIDVPCGVLRAAVEASEADVHVDVSVTDDGRPPQRVWAGWRPEDN